MIAGVITNQRYTIGDFGLPFHVQDLHCGQGGGLKDRPYRLLLNPSSVEAYTDGETYAQRADEIHASSALRGTVTLCRRRFRSDEDTARVFWPFGAKWGSAEPRPATAEEVAEITGTALRAWFK